MPLICFLNLVIDIIIVWEVGVQKDQFVIISQNHSE